MADVISFGESLIDMIRNGDGSFTPFPGGAPANFAVGCSRLGISTGIITSVGKDFFGRQLLDVLKNENIDTSHAGESLKKTTLAFVTLHNKIPEFIFYRGADTDIRDEDIDEIFVRTAKIFHFGSLSLTESPVRDSLFKCLKIAKNNGVKVSFSANIRKDIWRLELDGYLRKALVYVDMMILSEAEFRHITGQVSLDDAVRKSASLGIETIAVTMGKRGSMIIRGGVAEVAPIFEVEVVDTTGAGDAFSAGFMKGLLDGLEGRELITFANRVASFAVMKMGAMSALPYIEDLQN